MRSRRWASVPMATGWMRPVRHSWGRRCRFAPRLPTSRRRRSASSWTCFLAFQFSGACGASGRHAARGGRRSALHRDTRTAGRGGQFPRAARAEDAGPGDGDHAAAILPPRRICRGKRSADGSAGPEPRRPGLAREGAIPVSRRLTTPYFSLNGGLEETRHVFLAGNDLPSAAAGSDFTSPNWALAPG